MKEEFLMFEYTDPDYNELDLDEEFNDHYEIDDLENITEASDQNPYQWIDKDPLWQQGWSL